MCWCIGPDGDIISTQGTVEFFTELGFKQDEGELEGKDDTPKLLTLAYELQSPGLGEWTRKGWIDGWKHIGSASVTHPTGDSGPLTRIVNRCDTIDGMKTALTRLEAKLGSDPSYFRTVYNYTFHFARSEGQRSLGKRTAGTCVDPDLVHLYPVKDTALEYWKSLLYFGVGKEALRYEPADDEEDVDMDHGQGWTREHTEMWLEYMKARDDIAVSKDTWQMVRKDTPFHRFADEMSAAPRLYPLI